MNETLVGWERDVIEKAAPLIHEDYLRHRRVEGTDAPSAIPYSKLPLRKRRSNEDAAADIPRKLRKIGHGLRPLTPGASPRTPDIRDDEVLTLARLEHERWCRDQRLQNVVYSAEPVTGTETSPYLVDYDRLPDEIKQYDIQAVYRLPVILRELGFEIYRMEEAQPLDDPSTVDRLARALHENYCQQRRNEGQSSESNSSLVDFDELPEDLKASNVDQVEAIPRKLRSIGLNIRRVLPGVVPEALELSPEKIEQLAKLEHSRWNWQRILQGWTYAPGDKDNDMRTTPHLVPWDDVRPDVQEYDRQFARLIPQLLKEAGYEGFGVE